MRIGAVFTGAFVALSACTPEQSVPATPLSAPEPAPALMVVVPAAGRNPAPLGEPTISPTLVPQDVPVGAGGLFAVRPLPASRPLGHGWLLPPLLDGPDRAVLVTAGKRGELVDSRTGAHLASLPSEPQYVAPRAGAVVLRALQGSSSRVLRVLPGQRPDLVEPTLSAGGAPLHDVELIAMKDRPQILALAQGPDGTKLMGPLSSDLTHATLTPTELRPGDDGVYSFELGATGAFELYANTQATAGKSGTPFSLPHGAGCVLLRVEDDARARCLEYRPMLDRHDPLKMLGDGWFFGHEPDSEAGDGWDPTFLSNVAWGERRVPLRDLMRAEHCRLVETLLEPPRALVTCARAGSTSVAALWSPDHLDRLALPPGTAALDNQSAALDGGTVVPLYGTSPTSPRYLLSSTGQHDPPTTRWLDMASRRVLATPPLTALAWLPDSGLAARSFARAEDGSIWLLDFAGPTRTRIEGPTGCPGVLHDAAPEGADLARFRALVCFAPAAKGHLESRVLWSQLLDLRDRAIYRTPLNPVSWHADGTVILTTAREIRGEGAASLGEIVALDLGGG